MDWRVKERRDRSIKPPSCCNYYDANIVPKIAKIPKARMILSLGDTVPWATITKIFNFIASS